MSAAYWSQWSRSEILSLHGIELDEPQEESQDNDCDDMEDDNIEEDYCKTCADRGCNYCLALDY